ncbi:MAG: HesA/MoeB/ThiF family protein [Thaumarchaeota archaeon]|nr:HesA/MoeB/ThiF family protein [Nitrososphaerota archaeon]
MTLADSELERYSRQIVLDDIGFEGQEKLRKAVVTVVGAGGLGTPIAQQLVAMGIGKLRLVDRDVVEISNLHRQILYSPEDVGLPKVEVAIRKLKKMNPDVEFEPITASLNDDSAKGIVRGSDIVLDGLDSIYARYALNRACLKLSVPYVFGSAIETTGSATTIIPKKTPCLECLYPNLRDEDLPKCGTEGVHPSILTIVSSVEVSEAVKVLVGKEPSLAGQLFYADIRDVTFDKIKIARQSDCRACNDQADLSEEILPRKLVEDICGREQGKSVHVITPKENLQLDLLALKRELSRRNSTIKALGEHGVTFSYNPKINVSLVRSGVAIVVGASTEQKALEVYDDLVISGLRVPVERIDPKFRVILASLTN